MIFFFYYRDYFIFPLVIFSYFSFFEDKSNPLYIAKRIGIKGKEFNLIKIRTMLIGAELTKVDFTSENDERITKMGYFIRKYKIDELTQFIKHFYGTNVFCWPKTKCQKRY